MTIATVDCLAVLREYLAGCADLARQTSGRIYGDPDLPAGYTPAQGPAVTMGIRGGADDYTTKLLNPSVQFSVYGPESDMEAMWRTYRLLADALNGARSRAIVAAWMESIGQLVLPSRLGEWRFIFTAWRVLMHNQEEDV